MPSTRASSKGQMVIPKGIRERLGIRSGTELSVELLSDQSFRVTVRSIDSAALVRELAGSLAHRGRPLTASQEEDAMLAALRADDDRTRSVTEPSA